ncbi:MAG: ABC transporter ATP-binding protein, partial [Myxococcales bacterium]|nr:ABC transporter ATP-binding protein [Myxococcales bacterium]
RPQHDVGDLFGRGAILGSGRKVCAERAQQPHRQGADGAAARFERLGLDEVDTVPKVLALEDYRLEAVVGSRATLAKVSSETHPVLRLFGGLRGYEILVESRGNKVKVIDDEHPEGHWVPSPAADDSGALSYVIDLERYGEVPAKSAWKRTLSILQFEKGDFRVVVLYALTAGILSLSVPLGIQALVSTLRLGAVLQPLIVLVIGVVAALGLVAVLRVLEVRVIEMLQRRVLVRLVTDLVSRIPWAAGEIRRRGGASHMNRFFDVFVVHKSLAFLLLDGLDLALAAILGLVLLAFYHPILLAFDILLILGFALILFGMGRSGIPTSVYESKKKHAMAAWLDQVADHPRLFRSRNGFEVARDRVDELTRDYLEHRDEHFGIVLRQTGAALWLHAISSGALLGIGGWLVMQGDLTLGQLVAAEIVVALVVSSFAKVGKHIESFYDLVAAGDKVAALLDISDRSGGPSESYEPHPEVRGMKLGFRGARLVRGFCSPLTFDVAAGEWVAIRAASGAGKTTLADALVEPSYFTAGDVEIDDASIHAVETTERYDRIEIVRLTNRWHGTLLEHLRLGSLALESAEAMSHLEELNLKPVVAAWPEGIETELSPDGRPLSYVESVKVEILRGVLRQPDLIIIDGLLDGLEEQDVKLVLEFIRTHCPLCTLLVLTRLASVSEHFEREVEL